MPSVKIRVADLFDDALDFRFRNDLQHLAARCKPEEI